MGEHWSKEPDWEEYAQHVMEELIPALARSSVMFSIYPSHGTGDVKFWVELGASIMMDKPIIVVAPPAMALPERLKRVADHILYADMDDSEARQELANKLAQLAKELTND